MATKNLLVANIGLGSSKNKKNTENRTQTFKRVHDTLWRATQEVGKVSLMAIQELGDCKFVPAPFFGPTATDDSHLMDDENSNARGVGIYARSNCFEALDNHEWRDEIVAVSDYYPWKNGVKKRFGLINVYRLTHKDNLKTVEETVKKVKEIIKIFRLKNVYKILIVGDFNTESRLDFGDKFTETTHDSLFHKHNNSTRKTKIDRVFSNFSNEIRIEAVFPSIEAVNKNDEESLDLGHKAYVIQIGRKVITAKPNRSAIVSIRNLKKESKKPVTFKEYDAEEAKTLSENQKIKLAECLPSDPHRMLDVAEKAKTQIRSNKAKSNDHVLIEEIEKAEDARDSGKKQDKLLIKAAGNIKNGLKDQESEQTERCSLSAKSEKLQTKLKNFNPTDLETGLKIVHELYGGSEKIEANWLSQKKKFKSVVWSTSNSGALDCFGLSLKMTKTFLRNSQWANRFKEIVDLCLVIGYFPNIWRDDEISFLFKSGDRKDGKNYRPITIAPSLGKHFERVIAEMMRPMDDLNHDNHAYKSRRSCLTAIVALQKKLTYARLLASEKDLRKYKCISMISPDDIADAFESIDHKLVAKAIELIFSKEKRANLPGVILSYLDRRSTLIDRSTGERIALIKTFIFKTSPQGSILSPLFWRIYDGIFTKMYKNNLELLQEQEEDIIVISHVSYADDHLTVVTFWVEIDETVENIAYRSSQLLFQVRSMLADATKQLGCGINPLKSENIVPDYLAPLVDTNFDKLEIPEDNPNVFKGKSKFKWLGYYLKLRNNHTIEFSEHEIVKRINQIHKFRREIYQYTNNIRIKFRIYQVFISPFVELYTPFVAQSNINSITCVHTLQHRSLCEAVGIPTTANRDNVEEKLGERSVLEKTKRMACRIIEALDLDRPEATKRLTRQTRNNKNALLFSHDKNDRQDFTHRLDFFKNLTVKETAKVRFNHLNIKRWANSIN